MLLDFVNIVLDDDVIVCDLKSAASSDGQGPENSSPTEG